MKGFLIKNKKVIIYAIAFFLFFLFDFSLNSILSFKLGESDYLFYQKLLNVIPFFTVLTALGIPFSLTYFTAKAGLKNTKKLLYEANNLGLKIFIVILSVVAIIVFFDFKYFYILVGAVLAISLSIKQNVTSLYLGNKNLLTVSVIRIVPKLIFFVVVLATIFLSKISGHLFLGFLFIVAELISLYFLHFRYTILSFNVKPFYIKRAIKYGKYSFLCNLASMIALSFPILFMDFINVESIRIVEFSISYILIKYSSLLLAPFMQLVIPYFASSNDSKKIVKMFNKYSLLLLLIGIIVSILSYFFVEIIIRDFFDKKYLNAVVLFKKFCFIIPLLFLASFSSSALASIGKIIYVTKNQFISLGLMLSLGSYLIFEYQEFGAFLAILSCCIFKVGYNYFIFFRANKNLLKLK